MRNLRSSSIAALAVFAWESWRTAAALSALASPTAVRRRSRIGTRMPPVMASPRKKATNCDAPDSTVTSSPHGPATPGPPFPLGERSPIVHAPGARSRGGRGGSPKGGGEPPSALDYNLRRAAPVLRRVEGSMWGRLKTIALATVVGAVALVPLFGDPRSTPVTHPLWARMLLRSLDMTEAVRASTQASQVFSTLAWRDSLSYPADEYLRAEGAVVREAGGRPVLDAGPGPAEVVYALAITQPGRLPDPRPPGGRPRGPGDGRGPADGGREGDQGVHPAPGPPSRAGSSPARPTSTPAPTPPSSSCPPAAR